MSNPTTPTQSPSGNVLPMMRTPINPWTWSLNVGYNQAEILEGANRQLICAGQTAVDADGNASSRSFGKQSTSKSRK